MQMYSQTQAGKHYMLLFQGLNWHTLSKEWSDYKKQEKKLRCFEETSPLKLNFSVFVSGNK